MFQGSVNSLARGFGGCSQRRPHRGIILLLEEPQQKRVAVFATELVKCFVDKGANLLPKRYSFRVRDTHGENFLFTCSTSDLHPEQLRSGEARRLVKPARQYDAFGQRSSLASQCGEDQLRGILRQFRVTADAAEGAAAVTATTTKPAEARPAGRRGRGTGER